MIRKSLHTVSIYILHNVTTSCLFVNYVSLLYLHLFTPTILFYSTIFPMSNLCGKT